MVEHIRRPGLKNLSISTILKKTMDFFEVTGGFRLVEPGGTRRPRFIGAMRIEQNSPMDTLLKRPAREPRPPARRELKESPSSLDQEGLCKGFIMRQSTV